MLVWNSPTTGELCRWLECDLKQIQSNINACWENNLLKNHIYLKQNSYTPGGKAVSPVVSPDFQFGFLLPSADRGHFLPILSMA